MKHEECHHCGFITDLKVYTRPLSEDEFWLCGLCAGTIAAGNSIMYPGSYSEEVRLLSAHTSYCTNAILKAIREQPFSAFGVTSGSPIQDLTYAVKDASISE